MYPDQNPALSVEERVHDLLGRMTLREKIGQLTQRLYGFTSFTREGENAWHIFGGQRPKMAPEVYAEGDWSNAAFPLCMGAVSGKIRVCGLDPDSRQGDTRIYELLREFGASVEFGEGVCTAQRVRELRGIDIDASQIPDLVPGLAVVAALAEGTTRIFGAARLRLKESDRLCATARLLNDLGANAKETDDGLVIEGVKRLYGNEVDSCNDHRIAMCAAVAALACDSDVLVRGAECVSKSYPDFWDDFESLGSKTTKE